MGDSVTLQNRAINFSRVNNPFLVPLQAFFVKVFSTFDCCINHNVNLQDSAFFHVLMTEFPRCLCIIPTNRKS